MSGDRLNEVLASLEGEYFVDYALFTGSMREYTVRALENRFAQGDPPVDPQGWRSIWPARLFYRRFRQPSSDLHRRMFMLAVYREQYMAYEDLGAFLDGFLTHAKSPTTAPLTRIMNYRPGEALLVNVFGRFEIKTGDDLFDRLALNGWVPARWKEAFADIDLVKVMRRACAFFVIDCTRTQKKAAVDAFNKLKHGLLFVPSARTFQPNWMDVPGILIKSAMADPAAVANPVTVYQIPVTDELLLTRLQAIHFVQNGLRLLAALYAITQHAEMLERRGMPGLMILAHLLMADAMDIARQASNNDWNPANGKVSIETLI